MRATAPTAGASADTLGAPMDGRTRPQAVVVPEFAACGVDSRRMPGRNHLPSLAMSPATSPKRENIMNWDVIEGNWKQFKGHVKEKWGKLTDDHLDTIAGKRDQLAGRIQEAYGITKDQAELQLKAFEELHKHYQPKATV
jgi:uncharacterized protein YjbJ (UPF0337 family)